MAKRSNIDSVIQAAVVGWIIPIMSIGEVYAAGEKADAAGEDVTAAVTAVLERVAERA